MWYYESMKTWIGLVIVFSLIAIGVWFGKDYYFGCRFDGKRYKNKEIFLLKFGDGCSLCFCDKGAVTCEESDCLEEVK